MTAIAVPDRAPLGALLRDWRRRRRVSQLELALDAGVSARHVSFLETGRSRPSREMVLRLAERLDVPLRERNGLLLAAGYAPAYAEHDLDAPEMAALREAITRILAGHEPYPAIVVDRWWELVAGNRMLAVLTEGVAPDLLAPPVNVLRLALHPDGLAPRIANLAEWRAHLLGRLHRQAALTGDPALAALEAELLELPAPPGDGHVAPTGDELAVMLHLRVPGGTELALISTVATFGTAVDVTLAELALETFLPADAATAQALAELAGTRAAPAAAGAPL